MRISAILKEIKIKNSDTDTYASVKFDIDLKGVDLNKLTDMKHKELSLEVKDNETL